MTVVERWKDATLDSLRGVLDHGETTEGLSSHILEHVRTLVSADQVISFELDLDSRSVVSIKTAPHLEIGCDPMFQRAFWTAHADCESHAYSDCDGKRDSITILSDFYSPEELRQTRMYQLCRNYVALDHVMTAVVPSPAGVEARIMFFRRDRDFDDRDRTMLALLQPHLTTAHRRATERREGVAALTPRQQAIMHLVARGLSNEEIAQQLVLSPGTVRKHLDNAFRQLGVSSRAAAVARAFPEGVPPYPNSIRIHPLPRAREGRAH